MSVTEQPRTLGAAADVPAEPAVEPIAVDPQIGELLAAIRADDGDAIAAAFDRLGETRGPAAVPALATAVARDDLAEKMLAALKRRAQTLNTPRAWTQLAAAAGALGNGALAVEAASAALERDPGTVDAAFLLIAESNRRGEYDAALNAIDALAERVPAARSDPHVVYQAALAQLGRKEPRAALALIEPVLRQLAAINLAAEAQVLRARALDQIAERTDDAIVAWRSALESSHLATPIDFVRNGLIMALARGKRLDESLRELDLGLQTTRDPGVRAAWLETRSFVLAAKGDADGAVASLDDLLQTTNDAARRLDLRLRQARIAANAARWRDAAARFDVALTEIDPAAPDARERRRAVLLEKAQTLAKHDIDAVLADLDELDAEGKGPDWPTTIDMRIAGLLAAGRADLADAWLTQRLAQTPALAEHPAAHQVRADIELKRGNTEVAMAHYARAVQALRDDSGPRALGAALMGAFATQQWTIALQVYTRLAQTDPASATGADARAIGATANLRAGNLDAALQLTEGAPPAAVHMAALRDVTRGEALVRLGRLDEALAFTAESLQRLQARAAGEVPAEFLVSLHALRAQAFNKRKEFQAAREAATAALAVPEQPGVSLQGLTAFVRGAAFIHRSLAAYRLKDLKSAHADVDAAIGVFDKLRDTAIVRALARAPEFAMFESALWYAKGAVFDAESRREEALAAYTRADRLERQGNSAAVARGYALAATGAYGKALEAFDIALARAASDTERADAFEGKGRALVRLGRYEDAITALQAGLAARLLEPDHDPGVFELLGIAYTALQRYGAAMRAFRRAWDLTEPDKRSANLARGVTAAELRLNDPAAALAFLDALAANLKEDRTLLFNRALALDALGQRREAIGCLVRARKAGLDKAQEELARLDAPAGLARWTHHWFGAHAGGVRRAAGYTLLAIAALGLCAPLLQWWVSGKLDWYLLLLPSAVALALLALPNIKSIAFEGGGVKFSAEPLSATERDVIRAAPEGFNVPVLGAVSLTVTESRSSI
jgi:tetratricopeptide (TPR) repeat protein